MELQEVAVPSQVLGRLDPLIGPDRSQALAVAAVRSTELLRGRTVWNLSSTATGGGVAEMLRALVGYIQGIGVDIRWLVVTGDPDFFAITKRIHNRLHGSPGDGGPLGADEAVRYRRTLDANLAGLSSRVKAGDVVLLHDPQTAGLATPLTRLGAHVVWRCHVGLDTHNPSTDEAWAFLRPFLDDCELVIFSRRSYVPDWVPPDRALVIPPSIDPFSPKNQDMDDATVAAILDVLGVTPDARPGAPARFVRADGTAGEVDGSAEIVEDEPVPAGAPLVVQVSRWDGLKDMRGVMVGFAARVPGRRPDLGAHLALVGPSTVEVADDPEGAAVLAECIDEWKALPADIRRSIHLVSLPMTDVDANAAMVNALQRRATVVVQKSLAEGFGLTVAEAMWKARPVVASAVGGIVDQVAEGTGILLDRPDDLDAFGDAVVDLLDHPGRAAALGAAARRHVTDHFVGDRHLLRYAAMIERVVG
jgi:trehalose synthase